MKDLLIELSKMFSEVEGRDEVVEVVDVNPECLNQLFRETQTFDVCAVPQLLVDGRKGYLWGATVYLSPVDAPMVWSEQMLGMREAIFTGLLVVNDEVEL